MTILKTIEIKPIRSSAGGLKLLEARGLIRLLKPTAKVMNTRTKTGAVDYLYKTAPKYGGHALLGVGKRNTMIEFSWHPGNEDFILINPGRIKYKPLYFVASFLKAGNFMNALRKGRLEEERFYGRRA